MHRLNKIKDIWKQYKRILKYLFCSIFTAFLEWVWGWVLLGWGITDSIIIVNTITIFIGALVHYFITMSMVFEKKNNIKSFAVYLISFCLGLLMQNFMIWLFYDEILKHANEWMKYSISKGMSLVVPFFLLYFVRIRLNQMITGYDLK